MPDTLTQEALRDIISYDPATGDFIKLKCRRSDWIGKKAGFINNKGYRVISINNKQYLAHRLAWLYLNGYWPHEIDHRDGDKQNNIFSNLRDATDSQNMHNQGKRRHNTSGFKGVTYNRNASKWLAQIKINWKNKYLGLFDTPEDAHKAYCEAAQKHHGEFARTA